MAILIALAIHLTAVADDDFRPQISKPGAYMERLTGNPLFSDYVYRRRQRYAYALDTRRQINASRPPAVYYRYNPNALGPFSSGIQAGWVRQPPIPLVVRRPVVVVVESDPFVPSYSD